ncbi:MAG TPA: MarR family transcriptional regulator [Candidatus Limnocylindrales bacterium]|nr:MarR family transcriptional regulator [Candidatus Limnocylindrales bacterium]
MAERSSTRTRRRTPAGDALSVVVIQVFQLNGLLTAIGDRLAKPAGQSTARWQVLAAAERGPMTVAGIARALRLARQSVQRVADLLVADGLATFDDNPAHRRAKLLSLTPAGLATLRTIQAAQRVWADEVGAEVGEADLRAASDVLHRLMRTLVEGGAGAE